MQTCLDVLRARVPVEGPDRVAIFFSQVGIFAGGSRASYGYELWVYLSFMSIKSFVAMLCKDLLFFLSSLPSYITPLHLRR